MGRLQERGGLEGWWPEEECPSLATEYLESLQDRLEQVHALNVLACRCRATG